MRFGRSALLPSYSRPPDFNSDDARETHYSFDCVNCNQTISFEFNSLLTHGYSWREAFGQKRAEEVIDFYRIGIVEKSPDGGFPAMILNNCDNCNTNYLIYAGVKEVSNSVLVVTMQGITELLDQR